MYLFKILSNYLKENKLLLIVYILFLLLSYPLEAVVIPQIYSKFFDELNVSKEKAIFIKYLFYLSISLIIINLSNCITSYIDSTILPSINEYLINYIYKNLLLKYENDYQEIELGKLISRLTIIPQYFKEMMADFCVWLLPKILTAIVINIYFFYINFKLGVISSLLLILFFYLNLFYFFKCSKISNERHKLFEKKNEDTQDKLYNMFSIYSSGNLNKEITEYKNKTKIYTNKFKDNLKCIMNSTILTGIIIVILFVSLNSATSYLYLKKELSFPSLMAVFITILYYIPCILNINSTLPDVIHYYGALKSVDHFLEDLYNIDNSKKEFIESIPINRGIINIKNLNFGYNDSLLFNNFNLKIKENEKVAIVGMSGNGKSTLIKLIMGYYKVDDKSIFIDNNDINNFDLTDLRKQISYVNQNIRLFNKTLLENIQYGNNLSREEVIDIFDEIGISNIFKNLKDGLDTNVGVNGEKLSGGQRQIIHILRCIGKQNKIVILDEPTASIDKKNSEYIIRAIEKLSKSSTLIIITHNKQILKLVDRIITLDSGKIISDQIKGTKVPL
jgi:ABC-type multidrug transport system fused ATPase/permease subunit